MSVFDELIDQEAVVTTLKAAVAASKLDNSESQEMTHAWLFTGPPGSGRSNAATAFAAALVCSEGGCGTCIDCATVKDGTHADVDSMRTEGLSIKIDDIRELVIRASWSPSVANFRIVIIEDADRLTESAANALLKAIEEPNQQTVWLLCAPSTTDVLPTIRSRTRVAPLRTPSINAVANLLTREGISPSLAHFAANASQGHVGRARYLATSASARSHREEILKSVFNVRDIASAFNAAQQLVEAAKVAAEQEAEARNEKEIQALRQAWGTQTTKIASANTKAIKELEKDQKSRATRLIRDYLDLSLLDVAGMYRDLLLANLGAKPNLINTEIKTELALLSNQVSSNAIARILEKVFSTREAISKNASPLLAIESLLISISSI